MRAAPVSKGGSSSRSIGSMRNQSSSGRRQMVGRSTTFGRRDMRFRSDVRRSYHVPRPSEIDSKEAHRLEFAGPAAVDVDTGLDGLVDPLVQFFREAAEAGALHTADPRALAYTLLYGARGYLSMVFAAPDGAPGEIPDAPPDGAHDSAPEAARRGAALLAALCFDGFGR